MDNKETCSLCLEHIRGDNFSTLDDVKRDKLQYTAPGIALQLDDKAKICLECLDGLSSSYEFKADCLERSIVEQELEARDVKKELGKCCLCQEDVDVEAESSTETKRDMFRVMLKQCLPDLNVHLKGDVTQCLRCSSKLKSMFAFISKCVSQHGRYVRNDSEFCFIKVEPTAKPEDTWEDEAIKSELSFRYEEAATTDPLNVIKFKCDVCSYEAKHKHYLNDHKLKHLAPSETTMYRCFTCTFETKRKSALRVHLLTHKDPSEVTMYKCETCSYETKWHDSLKKHSLRHKSPADSVSYKCESCNYVTHKKHLLRPHLRRHKNPGDITMFKCEHCPYEAKQKSNLQKHVVKHKQPSEITMYACGICPYATKWQSGIKAHRLKHRKRHRCERCQFEAADKTQLYQHLLSHPEVRVYECGQCTYSTKYKANLNKHMTTHKDSSEVPAFKCEACPFVTKHKTALKNHGFVHLDPADLTAFKCSDCTYETFRRSYLLKHVERHKAAAEQTDVR